jgi:hypothetical protein
MSNPKVELEKGGLIERYTQLREVIAYSNIVKNKSNEMLKTRKEIELRRVVCQNNLITSVENNIRTLYIH